MLPSSSNHGIVGVSSDEYQRNNHSMHGVRGSYRRENAQGFPGNSQYANGSTSSRSSSLGISLSTGLQYWEQQFESGAGMLDVTAFPPPEFGGPQRIGQSRYNPVGLRLDDTLLLNEVGPQRSGQRRYNPVGPRLDSTLLLNEGGPQRSGQSRYNPVGPRLDSTLLLNDGGPQRSGQSRYNPVGPRLDSTLLLNEGGPQRTRLSRYHPIGLLLDSTLLLNPHCLVQGNYIGQSFQPVRGTLVEQQFRSNNDGDTVPGSRYQRPLLPTDFRMYRRHQRAVQQALQRDGHRPHLRILPEAEVAILEFSDFRNSRGPLSDLRLDIDRMSYEELLALGERIGNAKIELTKETITRHLKTRRYHMPPAASINLNEPSGMDQEAEICIICQEEFENMDEIGTLECGHEYHAKCIKKWLLVKNVCPICKSVALSQNSNDG